MDNLTSIATKFEQTLTAVEHLNDHRKKEFFKKNAENLEQINSIIDSISNTFTYDTAAENDLDDKRQRIITKLIFPQYWCICERINELNEDQVDQLSKKIEIMASY